MPHPGAARRAQFLPFSRPVIEEDEIAEVVACLRSGWLTSGPRVLAFEKLFRERLGVAHAIAVNSATAGLHIVLHALGVGPGDEVIVPALTWVSTANVVELLGARAVLADVDPGTLQLDPAEVARLLGPRTKAVIPVHFAGAVADLDAIRAVLADRPGVAVVEDAAHALGSFYKGREIGSDGTPTVFSFHPIKNITTGEGGMIVCDDDALAARLKLLRAHGVSKDAWTRYGRDTAPRYDVVEPGYKYNMMDIQAALGLIQTPKLDGFNAARARLAHRYDRLLAGLPGVRPIARPPYDHHHAWHLYVVRLDLERLSIGRDEIMAAMGAENIGVGLHFVALHEQAWYRPRSRSGLLPNASAASESILSLPLHPGLSEADQDDVVAALRRVLAAHMKPADARVPEMSR